MLRLSFLPADTDGHVRIVAAIKPKKMLLSFSHAGKSLWVRVTPFCENLSGLGRTLVWVRDIDKELYSMWFFPDENKHIILCK